MAQSILVTGASGTIGRELVNTLLKKGVCVRIGVRSLKRAKSLNLGNCPVVLFDFEKPDTFKAAFEGIQRFFLATPLGQVNIDKLIIPAINAAKSMGVSHLVTIGGVGVDQDGGSPLSVVERCILRCGIEYGILRPNLFMQNILNLSSVIKEKNYLPVPAGNAHISFVDARDVAEAAANLLLGSSFKNNIYVLTGKESPDFFQVASLLSEVTNRTITYLPVSHSEAYQQFTACGIPQQKANLLNGLFEIARQGWCEEIRPDLAEILKHDPISLKQFAWDYKTYW